MMLDVSVWGFQKLRGAFWAQSNASSICYGHSPAARIMYSWLLLLSLLLLLVLCCCCCGAVAVVAAVAAVVVVVLLGMRWGGMPSAGFGSRLWG